MAVAVATSGGDEEQRQRARAAREALVGRTVAGKYVLQGLLGHGGMGAVYEAEHQAIGKKVAIKFVDAEFATEEQVVKRFAREARALSAIESAHIVSVFDAGTEDGRPYLVMELLRGEDLGQRLRRTRRVPIGEAMHVIAQVLKGLARAHAAGIVHRDLKPDNVFLAKTDTDPVFAKIVDFGISKIERPRVTTSPLALNGRGTVLGTPLYMSPEQAQCSADVDARADLYSVGAILFECLTGRPPHTGETYEQIILSICMRDAPELRAVEPSISEEVSRFVARALARDKTQRYASAERMLAALHEVAPEERARVPLDLPAPKTLVSGGGADADAMKAIVTPTDVALGSGAPTRLGVASLDPPVAAREERAGAPSTRRAPVAARAPAKAHAEKRAQESSDENAKEKADSNAHAHAPDEAPAGRRRPAHARALGAKRPFPVVALAVAIGATLTGVGVTFGILYATGRDAAAPDPAAASAMAQPPSGVHRTTSAAAPSASGGSGAPVAFAPLEETPPSATASASPSTPTAPLKPAATSAAKPSTLPPLPANGRAARPPSPKLDIQRDLP